jgi:pimeloyl-ACP methyl ester carboxylesterase
MLDSAMIDVSFKEDWIRLADGRRLAFSTTGPGDGFPILYLHGAIGSPLRASVELARAIERLGLRWICVQRPGFGASDAAPGRRMVDFAADVAALAAALDIGRLALVGVSAGGPYALACARGLPAGLVGAAAVCSSLSPLCPPHAVPGLAARMRVPMRLIAAHPRPATAVLDAGLRAGRDHPRVVMRAMTVGAPRADRVLVDDPHSRETAVAGLLAATAGGVEGLVEDYLVCCRPWGFRPQDVEPEIHLWHGARDALVPVEHAWQLAAALPRCTAAVDPDDGHFFFRRRTPEILDRLTRAAKNATGAGSSRDRRPRPR